MQIEHNGYEATVEWREKTEDGWRPSWWLTLDGGAFPIGSELDNEEQIAAIVRDQFIGEPPPSDHSKICGGYVCSDCGAARVRLWRRYQTFLGDQMLLCKSCCERAAGKPASGDQIGWHVPAVPTEDGSTFWGYTSVPLAPIRWWKELPVAIEPEWQPISTAPEDREPARRALVVAMAGLLDEFGISEASDLLTSKLEQFLPAEPAEDRTKPPPGTRVDGFECGWRGYSASGPPWARGGSWLTEGSDDPGTAIAALWEWYDRQRAAKRWKPHAEPAEDRTKPPPGCVVAGLTTESVAFRCPMCGAAAESTGPGPSWMNSDQWDATKAGDYFCTGSCRDSRGGLVYFSDAEVERDSLRAEVERLKGRIGLAASLKSHRDTAVLAHLTDAAQKIAPCPDDGRLWPADGDSASAFRAENGRWPLWWEMAGAVRDSLRAELAELQAKADRREGWWIVHSKAIEAERDSLRAEVERLRDRAAWQEGRAELAEAERNSFAGQVDQLEAEVERLEVACERDEARAALALAEDSAANAAAAWKAEHAHRMAAERERDEARAALAAEQEDRRADVDVADREFAARVATLLGKIRNQRAEIERNVFPPEDEEANAAVAKALARSRAGRTTRIVSPRAELVEAQAKAERREDWWIAHSKEVEAERDSLRAEVERLAAALAESERMKSVLARERDELRRDLATANAALARVAAAGAPEVERLRTELALADFYRRAAERDRDEARAKLASLVSSVRALAGEVTARATGGCLAEGAAAGLALVVDLLDAPGPGCHACDDTGLADPYGTEGRAGEPCPECAEEPEPAAAWERKPVTHEWARGVTVLPSESLIRHGAAHVNALLGTSGWTIAPYVHGFGWPASRPRGAQ